MAQKFERFKEIKLIGAGAFGKTLLVEDQQQKGRRVVIKVPLSEETEINLMDDVVNNAVLWHGLEKMGPHPNIVQYLGHGSFQGHPVMITEYVKGKDLRKIVGPACLRNRPPMDLKLALRIGVDVCNGLAAAHNAGVFHSDIKPDNVLVREEDGVAKICDFGISQLMRSTSAREAGGTIPYMAPEVFGGKASFPADIWSFSVTLYEMVAGALPFGCPENNDMVRFIGKVQNENPAPPKKLNPGIGDDLNDVIMRGLEKKLERRFTRAQNMLHALQAIMRGEDPIEVEIAAARELIGQQKQAEAEALLNLLQQLYPRNAQIYLALGEMYSRAAKPGQSEMILRKGVAQCPTHAVLHLNLAMVLNAQKKRADAVPALEKAIKLGLEKKALSAEALLRNWKAGKG